MPADSDLDTSADNADASTSDSSSHSTSAQAEADFKKRQAGLNAAVDKLKKENATLKERLANQDVTKEEELSALRVKEADTAKQLKNATTERDLANTQRTAQEAEIARLKAREDAGKLIADKFKALLADHLIGDLKVRPDFADDAAYEAYLTRQQARLGGSGSGETQTTPKPSDGSAGSGESGKTSLREAAAGATPAGGGRILDLKTDAQTYEQLQDKMAALKPHDPNYRKDMDAYLAQLNQFQFNTGKYAPSQVGNP